MKVVFVVFVFVLVVGVVWVVFIDDFVIVIEMNELWVVLSLLFKGVDFNQFDLCGCQVIFVVLCENLLQVLDSLFVLLLIKFDEFNVKGEMLLMIVVICGLLLVVQVLVKCGVVINCEGWILLYYVCSGLDNGVVVWLIVYGVEINV